jgi:hypothetical protein
VTTGTGSSQKWTTFADEVIETMYATRGARACQALLPGRTVMAIQQRAHKLRVASRTYVREGDVTFGIPTDDRPDEIRALDYALRDFRECHPAANLFWTLGAVA